MSLLGALGLLRRRPYVGSRTHTSAVTPRAQPQGWPLDPYACRYQSRAVAAMVSSGALPWHVQGEAADNDMDSYDVRIELLGVPLEVCDQVRAAVLADRRIFRDWGHMTVAGRDPACSYWVEILDKNMFAVVLHCEGFGRRCAEGARDDALKIIGPLVPTGPDAVIDVDMTKTREARQ